MGRARGRVGGCDPSAQLVLQAVFGRQEEQPWLGAELSLPQGDRGDWGLPQ